MMSFGRAAPVINNPTDQSNSFDQPTNPEDKAGDQVIFIATPDTIPLSGELLTGTFEGEWLPGGLNRPDDITDNVTFEWSSDRWYESSGNEGTFGQDWKNYDNAILDMEGDYTGFAKDHVDSSGFPLPLFFYGASNLRGGIPFCSTFHSEYNSNDNHMQTLAFGPVTIGFQTFLNPTINSQLCGIFKAEEMGPQRDAGGNAMFSVSTEGGNTGNSAGPWVSNLRQHEAIPNPPPVVSTQGMRLHSSNCPDFFDPDPISQTFPTTESTISNRLFVRRKLQPGKSTLEKEGGVIHPHDPNFFIDPNGNLKINHRPVLITGTYKQLQAVRYDSGFNNPQPFSRIDPRVSNGLELILEIGDPNYDNEAFWTAAANEAGLELDYNPFGIKNDAFPHRVNFAGESIVTSFPSRLTWSTIEATSVTIDNGIGAVNTTGFLDVSPTQTTTYTLTAVGSFGTSIRRVTVHVGQ